ncbi:MAG: PilZ domain-containing protein [candidate division Zixibacteria bacterium]|nr:PilZ domain-containing protein [candidate division Zixibacteria bacterium]
MTVKRLKAFNARRFKRLRADYLVKYQVLGGKDGESYVSNIRDISAGGMRFLSEQFVPERSNLKLSVYIPPIDQVLHATARILRVRRSRKSVLFYVAVRFLDLDKDTQLALNDFVEQLSRDPRARVLVDHADVVIRDRETELV